MIDELDPDILQQVRAIVRRDLKLAPDAVLELDKPFLATDVDLDSLDMLLLVTSIERQFGVSIPDEAVGKDVFTNLATLTRYIQKRRGSSSGPAVDPLAKLPHGPAFRFVSRLLELRPGELARGIWATDGSEPFYAGHFPQHPIVPGVLIAEALAQISGLAAPVESPRNGQLAHIDLRFVEPISPPAEIELSCKIIRILGSLQMCEVTARVGDKVLAEGTLALHRAKKNGESP